MGSRGDNRCSPSGGGSPSVALHPKLHHEKRNQELLLKRLDMTSTAGVAKGNVMSKSLDLGSGVKGNHRPKRKSDLEKSLKSLQRQTLSSSVKKNNSLNEKDVLVDSNKGKSGQGSNTIKNSSVSRKRESVTGKPSANVIGEKKDNKRTDVFDRLSRQDCNKSVGGVVTRSEQGSSNRIRDRSPSKMTGRKSPQQPPDKHQRPRKSVGGDAASSTKVRRRDSSPTKKDDNGRKNSSSEGALRGRRKTSQESGGRPVNLNDDFHLENDKDSSSEKLERDNVPESLDKDLQESSVVIDVRGDSKLVQDSVRSGRSEEAIRRSGGSAKLEATPSEVRLSRRSPPSPKKDVMPQASFCATPSLQGRATPSKSSDVAEVLVGANKDTSKASEASQKTPPSVRMSKAKALETTPANLSKEQVMQKVRQRVPNDDKRQASDVVDDDKDVCEAEKCDEDDFYKIKVHTRLVSYSNSTLVIKKTSKSDGGGDQTSGVGGEGGCGQARDLTEADSSHPHTPPPSPPLPSPPRPQQNTLQTSSPPPTAGVPHSIEVEPISGVPMKANDVHPCEVEEEERKEDERPEGAPTPLLARSRSMRLKLSQFVCRGKNFLTDVYSATQSKLEQYTKGEPLPPYNNNNCIQYAPSCNTDSGYYSFTTSVEGMPGPSTECLCDDVPLRSDVERTKNVPSTDDGVDTPVGGAMAMEDEDQGEDGPLPAPPSPHVDFTLNEEWIKKNILCTCKCNRKAIEASATSTSISASQSNDGRLTSDSDKDAENEDTNQSATSDDVNSSATQPEESSAGATALAETPATEGADAKDLEDDDDLCLCSCHEGEDGYQLQQFPHEVQELLDADHARMWWTITGNFGNILPIDWSKTYTRQQYLPVLNLNEAKAAAAATVNSSDDSERTAEEDAEEEEVAQDLDLHHLILNGLSAEPVKSAEEVIKEIDDIMQEGSSSEDEGAEEAALSGANANEPITQPLPPPLYAEKLKNMSIGELNEAFMELELVIRQYSETLINQLALRDELEYEKELKNSFISLLLQVQNKRRNFNVEKKKQKKVGPNGIDPKYLTTVIPYDVGHGPPTNETLQILIKILMAINEDSPTVPTLLTDYILKVLCPS